MNGYILSIVKDSLKENYGKYETIIPGTSIDEMKNLIKGDVNKEINIYFNDKNIAFEFNKTIFNSIILPNKYFDTDRILNMEYSTKIVINRSDFIESLNRSNSIINDINKKPVILDIKDGYIEISLNSISGETYEKMEIKKNW